LIDTERMASGLHDDVDPKSASKIVFLVYKGSQTYISTES